MRAMTAGRATITVNGSLHELEPGSTILVLVDALKLRKELIAVERNRTIVSKSEYATLKLEDGDQIEIVEFVGGG
jgi:thiamine biosynthesis protein ThiS